MTDEKLKDPEEILTYASECLAASSENEDSPTDWDAVCHELSRAGRATWYRCSCGEISPVSGNVDAVCPKCGEVRRLPARLSRAPWPLYVQCLMHALPDWFELLARWMALENIGHVGKDAAYARHAHSGEGDGAYRSEAEDSAGGDVPPARCIVCMDGMRISDSGAVRGIAWIALPMPDVKILKNIR